MGGLMRCYSHRRPCHQYYRRIICPDEWLINSDYSVTVHHACLLARKQSHSAAFSLTPTPTTCSYSFSDFGEQFAWCCRQLDSMFTLKGWKSSFFVLRSQEILRFLGSFWWVHSPSVIQYKWKTLISVSHWGPCEAVRWSSDYEGGIHCWLCHSYLIALCGSWAVSL